MSAPGRSLVVVLALVLLAGPLTGPAHPAPPADSVAFTVRFASQLQGGRWSLATRVDGSVTGVNTLAAGTISPGVTEIPQPVGALLQSSTGQFTLSAFRKIEGTDDALVAVRSAGVEPARLRPGEVIELGEAAATRVRTYRSPDEALAAGRCPTCDVSAGRIPQPEGSVSPPDRPSAPVRELGATAPVPKVTPPVPGLSAPPHSCTLDNSCGAPVAASASSDQSYPQCIIQQLSAGFGSQQACLAESQSIPGVLAFRGWSGRIAGMTEQFSVQSGVQQKWQNGVRFGAGPFTVSGSTTRTWEVFFTDTWPLRGDCWSGGRDIPPCDNQGHERKNGRDTWRWEKWVTYDCAGNCWWTHELLYNQSYDGGNEEGYIQGMQGYVGQPSAIRAGSYGQWARHPPGASFDYWLGSSLEHQGADISVNFSSSYGSATFSSTMSHLRLDKVRELFSFRGDLPWFNAPANPPPDPSAHGWWYRYDFGTNWGLAYWSCEWARDWYGGSPCWTLGS